MPKVIVRLLTLTSGDFHESANSYLVSYDPDAHLPGGDYDGGNLIVTQDPQQAKVFTSQYDAIFLLWSGPGCECHRYRADGEINRPLRAFNAEIINV